LRIKYTRDIRDAWTSVERRQMRIKKIKVPALEESAGSFTQKHVAFTVWVGYAPETKGTRTQRERMKSCGRLFALITAFRYETKSIINKKRYRAMTNANIVAK